jgi:hypothetical protein
LIPANLPRQALRNEFFALLAVGRQPGSGPETGFWEVRQIGTDKSAADTNFYACSSRRRIRLQADVIINRIVKTLLAPEVSLRRLN